MTNEINCYFSSLNFIRHIYFFGAGLLFISFVYLLSYGSIFVFLDEIQIKTSVVYLCYFSREVAQF